MLALKRLSLEELANIEVTTVEKRGESLSQSAAAIHVLTGDDIKRSGATTLAEALRQVPGLQVARIDAHNWAISARGFNDLFANKLLVLIDGRSVYTPLYSGVHWQYQDVLLQDLDRIEVVRGPGATVWGANAVNGVINILTKPSSETQGILVNAGGGSPETAFGAVRYGGRWNETTSFRVYGKHASRDNFLQADGRPANDRWNLSQGGFRVDWLPSDESAWTLQGDLYGSTADGASQQPSLVPPAYTIAREHEIDAQGANLLGRWTRSLSGDSDLQLQAYYDYTRQSATEFYAFDIHQLDADFQHRFPLGASHEVVWGASYRHVADDVEGSPGLRFEPAAKQTDLFGAFIQDSITLVPDRLTAVLGTKIEHNDYSGWEIQPGARLSWIPGENQTVWASVARAVRTPSRGEVDAVKPLKVIPPAASGQPPSVLTLLGSDHLQAEELLALELGHRFLPIPQLSIDLAVFYNLYDHLITVSPSAPDFSTLPDAVRIPLPTSNDQSGHAYGAEAAVGIQCTEWWRIRTGYSWLRVDLTRPAGPDPEGTSPQHQAFLVSQMELPHDLKLDVGIRFVDRLDSLAIPAYTAVDVRLGWRPRENLEVSVVGQNLFDDRHPEFGSSSILGTVASEVPRGVYGSVTWTY